MKHTMGVWIDHSRAVIVSASEGRVTEALESGVEGHPHYSGRHEEGSERKYEGRHRRELDQYYDRIIGQLGHPEGLLILGPGGAKLEFRERLHRSSRLSEAVVAVKAADKLTDPQIVAAVTEHFGVGR